MSWNKVFIQRKPGIWDYMRMNVCMDGKWIISSRSKEEMQRNEWIKSLWCCSSLASLLCLLVDAFFHILTACSLLGVSGTVLKGGGGRPLKELPYNDGNSFICEHLGVQNIAQGSLGRALKVTLLLVLKDVSWLVLGAEHVLLPHVAPQISVCSDVWTSNHPCETFSINRLKVCCVFYEIVKWILWFCWPTPVTSVFDPLITSDFI